MREIDITKLPEFDSHEMVSFFSDNRVGLRGFIAIHNTRLGPANGGTRYAAYRSEREALRDVLRLSRAMTYKCAIAGVPYGGGKAVIIADTEKKKRKSAVFLQAYANCINLFNGGFYTGEDLGMDSRDIRILRKYSKYIVGNPRRAGDLASWAALGVFSAMQTALGVVFGNNEIRGRTVAVKGLGKVGTALAELVHQGGGHLIGADVNEKAAEQARRRFPGIKIVSPARIYEEQADVFSPCAFGGDLNARTIPRLRAPIVCGAANNQLASPLDGERLRRKNILYIPDYVANAGALISVAEEIGNKRYRKLLVRRKILNIGKTVEKIILLSMRERKPTNIVADAIAEERLLCAR